MHIYGQEAERSPLLSSRVIPSRRACTWNFHSYLNQSMTKDSYRCKYRITVTRQTFRRIARINPLHTLWGSRGALRLSAVAEKFIAIDFAYLAVSHFVPKRPRLLRDPFIPRRGSWRMDNAARSDGRSRAGVAAFKLAGTNERTWNAGRPTRRWRCKARNRRRIKRRGVISVSSHYKGRSSVRITGRIGSLSFN